MSNIIEAGNLPEDDKVYLKKDIFGYRVVQPIKNPDNGKTSYFNLFTGGWRNLFFMLFLLALLGLFFLAYDEMGNNVELVLEETCSFCPDVVRDCSNDYNYPSLGDIFPNINQTES